MVVESSKLVVNKQMIEREISNGVLTLSMSLILSAQNPLPARHQNFQKDSAYVDIGGNNQHKPLSVLA